MSLIYVILINLILLFIFYVLLNHKINKNSTSALLEKYAREVEDLIVQLNRTVDDLLNLSEERVDELKKLIKKAERLLKNQGVKKMIRAEEDASVGVSGEEEGAFSSSQQPARSRYSKSPRGVKGLSNTTNPADLADSSNLADSKSLMEKTGHLLTMGHTKEEVAKILKINRAEVDFLESLINKGR